MKLHSLLIATIAAVSIEQAVAAPIYHIKDVGVLPGRVYSYPGGINDLGQLVGYSGINGTLDEHAFLYSNGTIKDLGTLVPGGYTEAVAINNLGQIVGIGSTSATSEHAFLYSNGKMTDLGTLGGRFSIARDINDSGQIVGTSITATNLSVPFLYSSGHMTMLQNFGSGNAYEINNSGQIVGDGPGGGVLWTNGVPSHLPALSNLGGQAFGINNLGDVTGHSQIANGRDHPFLYKNGVLTDLGLLGLNQKPGNTYDAIGSQINDSDQIVGSTEFLTPDTFFLYSDGTMYDFNTLLDSSANGWHVIGLGKINNHGWIAGTAITPTGKVHAVIFTPVPEPSSTLLFGLGVFLTGAKTRRLLRRGLRPTRAAAS